MAVRGIRGAVQAAKNTRTEIFRAAKALLAEMQKSNGVKLTDISAVFLTMTPDLNADFPAYAAREMGWSLVPLLCARELDVPKSMPKVIRALMLVNMRKPQSGVRHCYLGTTSKLRPDLARGLKP